jgi:hypothetical protein
MWKRDESPKPATPAPAPAPAATPAHTPAVPSGGDFRPQTARDNVNIGKSVFIKGELSGSEDLTIEGNVEGRIELKDNTLTIGPNGKIRAEVFAKQVIVLGEVTGNVTASEKVDIRDNGSVDGDVTSPLPRARTSAAPSTCSAPDRAPSPSRRRRLPRPPRPPPRPPRPPRPARRFAP